MNFNSVPEFSVGSMSTLLELAANVQIGEYDKFPKLKLVQHPMQKKWLMDEPEKLCSYLMDAFGTKPGNLELQKHFLSHPEDLPKDFVVDEKITTIIFPGTTRWCYSQNQNGKKTMAFPALITWIEKEEGYCDNNAFEGDWECFDLINEDAEYYSQIYFCFIDE